jgi:hypothetical protein
MDATSGAGTAYPFGAPAFTPVFSAVGVTRSLVLCVCFVDRCLSFCSFSFGHCVVCSSSIYGFWLPLWYLQTFHTYHRNDDDINMSNIKSKEHSSLTDYYRVTKKMEPIVCI